MSSAEAADPARKLVDVIGQISKIAPAVPATELDRVADILAELGIEIPDVSESDSSYVTGDRSGRPRTANQRGN
jgi:hypothetical protein